MLSWVIYLNLKQGSLFKEFPMYIYINVILKKKDFPICSEIAVIGHNPYQKTKRVIDRLISEYFPELLEGVPTVPFNNREYIEYISKKNNIDVSKRVTGNR